LLDGTEGKGLTAALGTVRLGVDGEDVVAGGGHGLKAGDGELGGTEEDGS
jgi:hypothetical protein